MLGAVVVVAALAGAGAWIAVGLFSDDKHGPADPMVIVNKDGVVLKNLRLSSTTGGCILIRDSTNITIRDSEIGPCAGNAIEIGNSSGIQILDSTIHPEYPVQGCCDFGDGVFIHRSSDIHIQGNIVAYGESNIELLGVKDARVVGNFLLNPLGPFPRGEQIQVWGRGETRSSDILIEANYTLASDDPVYTFAQAQWDAINLGHTDRAVVKDNYVVGGTSHSGCGLIADASANQMTFQNNTIIHTGQCGIGIASGTNQVVDGNRIFNDGLDLPNVGNTALYVWSQYDEPCGPVRVTNNVGVLIKPDGSFSSYWKSSGCDPVTVNNNTFDRQAFEALSPVESKLPPPSIPPRSFERPPPSPLVTVGEQAEQKPR